MASLGALEISFCNRYAAPAREPATFAMIEDQIAPNHGNSEFITFSNPGF